MKENLEKGRKWNTKYLKKNLYQISDLTSSHNFIFFCQSCSVISFEENLKKWREKIETHLLGEPRLSSIEPWKLKNWNRIYCPVFHGIAWYRCLFKILSNGVSTKKTGGLEMFKCFFDQRTSPTNEIVFEPDNQQVGRVENLPPFLNHLLQNLNPLKVKSKKKKAKKFSQFLNSSSFSL